MTKATMAIIKIPHVLLLFFRETDKLKLSFFWQLIKISSIFEVDLDEVHLT